MKISKALQNQVVPEWKIKYIDYKGLKKKLILVEKARISRERETRYLMSNYQTSSYIKSQEGQENQESKIDNESNYHSYSHELPTPTPTSPTSPISLKSLPSPPPPPNISRRTSCQSQPIQQKHFSFTVMAESANTFINRVSWKLHHIPKRPPISENTHNLLITSLETIMDQVNPEEQVFFIALEQELEKVKIFYDSQEKEAIKRFATLQQQLEELKALRNYKKEAVRHGGREIRNTSKNLVKQSIDMITTRVSATSPGKNGSLDIQISDHKEAKKKIIKAIFEFYRGIKLLHDYRMLNKSGFIKILKKYDRVSKRNGSQIYLPKVNSSNFIKSEILNLLIKDVEEFYVKNFDGGPRQMAIKKLRLPNNKHKLFNAASLRVGFYLGMSIPIIISAYNHATTTQIESWKVLKQLYIGISLPIIISLLMGINMYVWDRAHVNYKFIFEFNSRDNLDFQQYLEIPALLFFITSIVIFLNVLNQLDFIDFTFYPIILLSSLISLLFCPYPIFYYNARRWFLFTMGRQIACFYHRVEFRDFFTADVLNSLSYSFTTIKLLSCSFHKEECVDGFPIYIPFLGMIPATIRMIHCIRRYHDTRKVFPHLINALKYFSTIVPLWTLYFSHRPGDTYIDVFQTFWIISQIFATLYTFLWDILMDWSLFSLNSENYLLRDHLVYNGNWVYYAGIVINFFLRSSWVIILIVTKNPSNKDLYSKVKAYIAIGEMFRRWMWSFFRVENEHINNCGQFRAIKDVPLPFEAAPIQIKIGEDIINSDDTSTIDSIDDMIIDEKVNQTSTNWLVNLIRSNRANGTSKEQDWRDFESSKNENEYGDEDEDEYDVDDFIENPLLHSNQILSRRIIVNRLDNDLNDANYASRRLPTFPN